MLGVTEACYVRDRLADTLEQSYYRTIFDAQKQAGGVWDFERLGSNQITAALATEWSGKNWSQRLWNNNRKFARDPVTGEAISVPGDMTYQQWYHKYVAGNPDALAAETAVRNRAQDRKQFRAYRAVLGEEMPPER